jgi:hypothetical protein
MMTFRFRRGGCFRGEDEFVFSESLCPNVRIKKGLKHLTIEGTGENSKKSRVE